MSFWSSEQPNTAPSGSFWAGAPKVTPDTPAPVAPQKKTLGQKILTPFFSLKKITPVEKPSDASTEGIIKNTILGIPKAEVNLAKKAVTFGKAKIQQTRKNVAEAITNPRVIVDRVKEVIPTTEDVKTITSPYATKEQKLAATGKFVNATAGFLGGEDFAAKNLQNGKVSSEVLNFFKGETNPEIISEKIQQGYKVPKATADELASRLAPTKSVEEVKSVLTSFGKETPAKPFWGNKTEAIKEPVLPVNEKTTVTEPIETAPIPKQGDIPTPSLPVQAPQSPLLDEALHQEIQKIPSYKSDIEKIANTDLNVKNFNVSDESKSIISKTIEEVKPQIEEKIGRVLSNDEALHLADTSSRILQRSIGRDETLAWEAAMLKARQAVAYAAENGTVDEEYIKNLLTIKTQGTDIARKLQSLSIGAEGVEPTAKQAILEAVLRVNDNVEEVLKAAEGVDFKDLGQATEFYRKFIKPTVTEWLDLIRYNSMLSSPKTHIINVFSNFLNTTLVAPIEKALTGGLDFLGSKITGNGRNAFVGEGGAYLKKYFTNLRDASQRFSDVMRGRKAFTNLDTRFIPIATKGVKGRIVKTLSYPMKLLEGMDQFFTALAEGAERASLEYRSSKGVPVGNIQSRAQQSAAYRLFRQKPGPKNEGHLLNAIDQFTLMIQKLRNNKNPIVSNLSKFTVPFIQTPMNIFKQGIEYSPVGFGTIPGAQNKTEQLSKALIGSSIFAAAGLLLASNRLTWGEPVDTNGKTAFRAAKMQPYSVKIGDRWYSYQKLAPGVAFPLAMVAAINDTKKNKKIDDDGVSQVFSAIAKYGSFLADQSYAKTIGDILSSAKKGESGFANLASNYGQQLIPYRALGGWLARLTDPVQRKADSQADFIDKQVQLLMLNIPGLSQKVPARTDVTGAPIPIGSPVLNAFSPIQTLQQTPQEQQQYESNLQYKKEVTNAGIQNADEKVRVKEIYDRIQLLKEAGKQDEVDQIFNSLSDEDHQLYQDIKTAETTKKTTEGKKEIFPIYQKVQSLKESNPEEAQKLFDSLTDEQHKYYELVKKQLTSQKPLGDNSKPTFTENQEHTQKGIIGSVLTYAKAIGTDPVTAFNRIFTGQHIRYVANGAIVVNRLPLGESQGIKGERNGNTKDLKLDHRIPLELGGSNSEDNLILVPTDTWKSYTPVENYLGKKLRDKTFSKKEVQDLITKFKNGELTAEQVYNYTSE